MATADEIERTLQRWGNQLLRPGLHKVGRPGADARRRPPAPLRGSRLRNELRALVRGSPEVMVKVTGGGRGMQAIKEHLDYISREGELELENDRGEEIRGREALADIALEWQYGGGLIPAVSHRREAFHVMFSMPPQTDAQAVLWAAKQFACETFAQHQYALVLHDPALDPDSHRPHVHLIVRAEGRTGLRLNPRKADLAKWRQSFAERLQERGVAASATQRQSRGVLQPAKKLVDHHLGHVEKRAWPLRQGDKARATEDHVLKGWREIVAALARSASLEDRLLALEVAEFVDRTPALRRRRAQETQLGLFERGREGRADRERERLPVPERGISR